MATVLALFWALDPQKKLQDRCGRGVERKKNTKGSDCPIRASHAAAASHATADVAAIGKGSTQKNRGL